MLADEVSFQKTQNKRDIALLLQAGGIVGLVGDVAVLLLNLCNGQGIGWWIEHQGVSNTIFCILSVAVGTFLEKNARRQLRR